MHTLEAIVYHRFIKTYLTKFFLFLMVTLVGLLTQYISLLGLMYASLAGISAFATSWCFTVAVKWGKPSSIASLEFTGILISLIIDYFLYGYVISIADGICSFLLIVAGVYVFLYCQTEDENASTSDCYIDLESHLLATQNCQQYAQPSVQSKDHAASVNMSVYE